MSASEERRRRKENSSSPREQERHGKRPVKALRRDLVSYFVDFDREWMIRRGKDAFISK